MVNRGSAWTDLPPRVQVISAAGFASSARHDTCMLSVVPSRLDILLPLAGVMISDFVSAKAKGKHDLRSFLLRKY